MHNGGTFGKRFSKLENPTKWNLFPYYKKGKAHQNNSVCSHKWKSAKVSEIVEIFFVSKWEKLHNVFFFISSDFYTQGFGETKMIIREHEKITKQCVFCFLVLLCFCLIFSLAIISCFYFLSEIFNGKLF
jgi:hypothetical protein